jgi:hypothetical protein
MGRTLRIGVLTVGVLVALVGTTSGLLVILPAAVLAVALALGCFPGERVLEAMRRAPRRRPRVTRALRTSAGRTRERRCARGTALLAFHLAVRPPPLSDPA